MFRLVLDDVIVINLLLINLLSSSPTDHPLGMLPWLSSVVAFLVISITVTVALTCNYVKGVKKVRLPDSIVSLSFFIVLPAWVTIRKCCPTGNSSPVAEQLQSRS